MFIKRLNKLFLFPSHKTVRLKFSENIVYMRIQLAWSVLYKHFIETLVESTQFSSPFFHSPKLHLERFILTKLASGEIFKTVV